MKFALVIHLYRFNLVVCLFLHFESRVVLPVVVCLCHLPCSESEKGSYSFDEDVLISHLVMRSKTAFSFQYLNQSILLGPKQCVSIPYSHGIAQFPFKHSLEEIEDLGRCHTFLVTSFDLFGARAGLRYANSSFRGAAWTQSRDVCVRWRNN